MSYRPIIPFWRYNKLMLLTNHTLTGVALGLVIDQPLIGLPVGVASHLVQDSVPHVGPGRPIGFRHPFMLVAGSLDFTASLVLTAAAVWARPDRAAPILAAVLGATLPDLTYIPPIVFGRERIERWFGWYRPMLKFLADLQWYERPFGLATEVLWASGVLWLLHGPLGLF